MKILLIVLLTLISITVHGSPPAEPEDIRQQYLAAVASAKSIDDANQFLSSDSLEKRKSHIEKLAAKKGKSVEEIGKLLLERGKSSHSCITDLKIINKVKAASTATVTYSFKDICAEKMVRDDPEKYKDAIFATIEDVNFVNENGWKIDSVSPRPEKPKVIRETIKIENK